MCCWQKLTTHKLKHNHNNTSSVSLSREFSARFSVTSGAIAESFLLFEVEIPEDNGKILNLLLKSEINNIRLVGRANFSREAIFSNPVLVSLRFR